MNKVFKHASFFSFYTLILSVLILGCSKDEVKTAEVEGVNLVMETFVFEKKK